MKNINKFVYDRTLTYLQKNRDYGNSVDKTRLILGEKADLVRMADKIHRIEQLALKQNEPKVAESIEDTILDLVVYLAIYESGKDRETMEQLSSPSRLVELIENLEDIALHPSDWFGELREELGSDILEEYTLNYIVNFIKVMTA
jgi:hypothetical protein